MTGDDYGAGEASAATFLLDVDNTLLDNDAVVADLEGHLERTCGAEGRQRYWKILERHWTQFGFADYLGAFERYRNEHPLDARVFEASSYLLDYDFASRLYPGALEILAQLRSWGPTVILTDGEAVYQPRKVARSGLWKAVEGRVLVYTHKEQMLDDVERRYPAERYVMVDDKLWILAAMKQHWGSRLTTVWVAQGRYASDPKWVEEYPAADVRLERIADLAKLCLTCLVPRGAQGAGAGEER